METAPLLERTVLITGSARRVGRLLAFGCARAGADIVLHHAHSPDEAARTKAEIEALGRRAWILTADLDRPDEAHALIAQANALSTLYALVNSAAIFEPLTLRDTTLDDWERHLRINLTAPAVLTHAARALLRLRPWGSWA